jgi:hypothetical protein
MVKWGCTDIDVEDLPMARGLQDMLEFMGITAHVERSRSKGYHVWVFASDWVPAADMRRTLLLAHERSSTPIVEVNPKQENLEGLTHGFGNYVRLPYTPAAPLGRRVVIGGHGRFDVSLSHFLVDAKQTLCAPQTLAEYAGLWTPPEPRFVAPGANGGPIQWPDGDAVELARKAGALAYTIFKDGPLEGSDRSTTMARLAHICADNGLTPTETFKLLAGLPWSKFAGRADHDQQVLRLVEGAF